MNKNIINFYLAANKLKEVIRTGWIELEISSDRLESVAEHVYGTVVLASAINDEYNLNLDMYKTLKMITIKELEKVSLKEFTTRDYPTKEERQAQAIETITKITDGLIKQEEILDLLQEATKQETKEAKFAFQVSKLESDLQAKIYDMNGKLDIENAKEDAKYFPEELANEIISQIKNASDSFILYDRQYYTDDIFKKLSKEVQDLN
ncbi:MAG: HD domain-containing protein [Bacilli bacterium]|nr:HD domain-containing protein [Bacilli bacterium]